MQPESNKPARKGKMNAKRDMSHPPIKAEPIAGWIWSLRLPLAVQEARLGAVLGPSETVFLKLVRNQDISSDVTTCACCCTESSLLVGYESPSPNLFDCARCRVVWLSAGRVKECVMIEMLTAFMGLISAGVFLAHLFEGVRSSA
jgi:hypothetical protein